MFVYTIQPVWEPAVSCIQPVVKPVVQRGLTTGWTNRDCSFNTVEWTVAVRSTRLSHRLYNRFDNWLYRVNRVFRSTNVWCVNARHSAVVEHGDFSQACGGFYLPPVRLSGRNWSSQHKSVEEGKSSVPNAAGLFLFLTSDCLHWSVMDGLICGILMAVWCQRIEKRTVADTILTRTQHRHWKYGMKGPIPLAAAICGGSTKDDTVAVGVSAMTHYAHHIE